MAAILNMFRLRLDVLSTRIVILLSLAVCSSHGGCTFPESWTGKWFQSGSSGLITINSTHIQTKGECDETDSKDKYILHDRSDEGCYRCIVIHEKHRHVLQYKETFCSPKGPLGVICEEISGDAPLYSMFRKEPRPVPQPCPFRPAPFTFTYNRGSGECLNPPSRAEACTDESRLLLRYMACPDIPSTESNVEELVCLATWKEGSTRYLVGQITQVNRKYSIPTDEDSYRCFIYKGQRTDDKITTYDIAQSGDASCNGVSSPTDGSRTIKLTSSDDEHTRCHFPNWVVDHHKWFSLDHQHQYHFTTKNATLKIMNENGSFEEKRLVCHSILEQREKKFITIVAHETRGCESGHKCLRLHWRDNNILEIQHSDTLWESPQDACGSSPDTPFITLITASLLPVRCPIVGRYSVVSSLADRRTRRQQIDTDESEPGQVSECAPGVYDSVSVGCGAAQDTIQFSSACAAIEYTCYGSWSERHSGYIVAAPALPAHPAHQLHSHPQTICFLYTARNDTTGMLSISSVRGSCDREVIPGRGGDTAYNLTINGTCEQSSKYNSPASRALPSAILMTSLALLHVR